MLHTGSSPPPHTMGCAMYERVNRYSRTLYPAINYVIDLLLTNINFVCVCERAHSVREGNLASVCVCGKRIIFISFLSLSAGWVRARI